MDSLENCIRTDSFGASQKSNSVCEGKVGKDHGYGQRTKSSTVHGPESQDPPATGKGADLTASTQDIAESQGSTTAGVSIAAHSAAGRKAEAISTNNERVLDSYRRVN